MAYCSYCGGTGRLQGDYPPCWSCNGRGDNGMDRRIPCNSCGGSGKANTRRMDTCWHCGGGGLVADPPQTPVRGSAGASPKRGKASAPPKKASGGSLDGIGKLMAVIAAVLAGFWAHGAMPETPASWFIVAAFAGALTFALRKLIVVVAGLAGMVMLFAETDEAKEPPRPVAASAPVARSTPAPTPAPVPVRIVGVCIANDLTVSTHYRLTLPGNRPGKRQAIEPGAVRHSYSHADSFHTPPKQVALSVEGAPLVYDLPVGAYAASGQITAAGPVCGPGGLPIYAIRPGRDGPEVWAD